MEIQPLKEYKPPRYPDKTIVHLNPNLLKKVPERWKGNVRVGVALSSLIAMMLTACEQNLPYNAGNNGTGLKAEGLSTEEITGEKAFVAPLFIHGDGRGSYGCMSIAPPAFLSEEEAFEVVQEEAERLELEFQKDGKVLSNIDIPITDIFNFERLEEKNDSIKLLDTEKGSLQLDGYNEENKIGFEFISKNDFVSWHKEKNRWASVESYNLIPAAETLKKGLEDNSEGNTIGIFYDPMIFSESINKKYDEKFHELREDKKLTEEQSNAERRKLYDSYEMELKQTAEEELREQVKDFLNWLKAESII